MSDPRLAGRKKAVLVLSYGLRALSPEGPSGSVPEGGRRRLHPGTGARHLVHFAVPPPDGALCPEQCMVGVRSRGAVRAPACFPSASASRLTASRDARPIALPI